MENERELEEFGKITWARDAEGIRGRIPCEAIRERAGRYAIDEENHRMWFRASNPGLQDDGLDIPTSAWKKDIKRWLKRNPVFMPFHDYGVWSLGHGEDAEIGEDSLRILIEFGYGRNPEATMGWELYKHRDMNAVSVGFRILESEDAEYGEGDEKKSGRRVTRAKLLELSAVPLPMDEDALAERMKRYAGGDPVVARACRAFACEHCQEKLAQRPGWESTDEWIHYRIRPPSEFDEGTYVILGLDVKGTKDVEVKRARLSGDADDGKRHAQAIQFKKAAGWDMSEAKSWWESHKENLMKQADATDEREIAPGAEDRIGQILELVTEIRLAQAARASVLTMAASGSATEIPRYIQQIDALAAAVVLDGDQVAARIADLANED